MVLFQVQSLVPLTLLLVLSFVYRSSGDFPFDSIHDEILAEAEEDTGFCPLSGPSSHGKSSCGSRPATSNYSPVKMASKEQRERTFIMVKPDGVQRGLVGEIIKRFEQKGFKLVAIKFQWASEELLQQHYAAHKEQPFFPGLIKYIGSGPVVPMVWEGADVIKTARQMLGATNPSNSAPGTIRGDFCIQTGRNAIHGSDSVDSANTETALWFKDEELVTWKSNAEPWIYE